MNKTIIALVAYTTVAVATVKAAEPDVTNYSWEECQGTYMPYPVPAEPYLLSDTLTPVMINHVGRHGARYPSSPRASADLRRTLMEISDNAGGLSATGRYMLAIVDRVVELSSGRWGALSPLGMAEQRGIASRMMKSFRQLFADGNVNAVSSWSPRCIMSMYEFVHQLSRLDTSIDVATLAGRCNSPILRFFDDNEAFAEFTKSESLKQLSDSFDLSVTPVEPFLRLMEHPERSPFSKKFMQKSVRDAWAVLTGMQAYGKIVDPSPFFTDEEQNRLWEVANMKHYLRRSANCLSSVPADISAPLLADMISTFDAFLADSSSIAPVQLRFGHAETLMPLLALIRLPGCYYVSDQLGSVGFHWCDFYVSPMAANLQLVLLRSKSGRLYLLTLLNERPVELIAGTGRTIVGWEDAKSYLMNRVDDVIYRPAD